MVLNKNWMAHHDVAKDSNGNWYKSIPANEQVEEEGADQARGGRGQQAPGRLEEGWVQARDHIEDAVADDKSVESCSLPLEYADASPQVDCKGEEED